MTRAFRSSSPKPYDTEGVKCYVLCPVFADTNLVRSSFEHESAKMQKGIMTARGKAANVEELEKITRTRMLTVNEVGDAMMKSLKYDKVFILKITRNGFMGIHKQHCYARGGGGGSPK